MSLIMEKISAYEYFSFDGDAYSEWLATGPFLTNTRHFTKCYVNPLALLKMLKHSIKGCEGAKPKEILGFLFGKSYGTNFLVNDTIPFAVEGTETRVVASDEYMGKLFEQLDINETYFGRPEKSCGWYHSHPGLECFFSEIDVRTHRNNQIGYKAFVGLVIDPINTTSSGKVHLGCYVTLPEEKGENDKEVPLDLLLKYGSAAYKYYELELNYFKTDVDSKVLSDIIKRSYGQSVSCSPLRLNANYLAKNINDVKTSFQKLDTKKVLPGDVDRMKTLSHKINEDRKTGIWIEKMKRTVFGIK